MIRLLAPRAWGAHLAMLLAVAAATALGLWQLHAWEARRAAARIDLTNAPAVTLSGVMGGDDPFPGRYVGHPVSFAGRWIDSGTVYVADRTDDSRRGYWVVTPVAVDGTRSAMPVVRGWAAEPDAASVTGTTAVTGWLQPGEGSGLPDADPSDDVVPELRIPSLVQRVDADLYSGYVIAEAPTGGLAGVRPAQAPTVGQTTALRNLLYAVEWWIFGGFAVVVWLRWCRDTLRPPPAEPSETAPGQPLTVPSVGSGT